jgi:hypothetical protein
MPATPAPKTRTLSEEFVIYASRICVTVQFTFNRLIIFPGEKKRLKSAGDAGQGIAVSIQEGTMDLIMLHR